LFDVNRKSLNDKKMLKNLRDVLKSNVKVITEQDLKGTQLPPHLIKRLQELLKESGYKLDRNTSVAITRSGNQSENYAFVPSEYFSIACSYFDFACELRKFIDLFNMLNNDRASLSN